MNEQVFNAYEELKRAEHLMYVSLKYTRTMDVIKSLIARLVAAYDLMIEGLLIKAQEEGIITEIPPHVFARLMHLKNLYIEDKVMNNYLEFYLMLRKMLRSESTGINEFRRNVTMISMVEGKKFEVTIDIASDYYHTTVEFFHYTKDTHLRPKKDKPSAL